MWKEEKIPQLFSIPVDMTMKQENHPENSRPYINTHIPNIDIMSVMKYVFLNFTIIKLD